jgi:hypothetical protein
MYWTKNGSIPSQETDGTEGWQQAPAPPEVPEGHELLWASWQWHILPPKPTESGLWRWYIDRGWVKREEKAIETQETPVNLATEQVINLTTAQL